MEILSGKLKKYLNNDIWYHGTLLSNWKSICENGVLANFNIDTSDSLDFGYGFYLATSKERAESYITRLIENDVISKEEQLIILGFEFNPLKWFEEDTYNTKILNKYDDEFALFVFENRTNNVDGSNQHEYDIIFGVMSDSVPTVSIIEYKMGRKTKEQVLEDLKAPTSMKQLSLHNQEICDIIKLKEAYVLDRNTNERKGLDINEYYR